MPKFWERWIKGTDAVSSVAKDLGVPLAAQVNAGAKAAERAAGIDGEPFGESHKRHQPVGLTVELRLRAMQNRTENLERLVPHLLQRIEVLESLAGMGRVLFIPPPQNTPPVITAEKVS